jgi:hypothetical protein
MGVYAREHARTRAAARSAPAITPARLADPAEWDQIVTRRQKLLVVPTAGTLRCQRLPVWNPLVSATVGRSRPAGHGPSMTAP